MAARRRLALDAPASAFTTVSGGFDSSSPARPLAAWRIARGLATSRRIKIGADRDHVADLRAKPDNLALDRRRDLDGRLVGHDRREDGVLPDEIADLDMPLNEFGFAQRPRRHRAV